MAYSLKYRAGWGVAYRSVTNSGENKNVKKKKPATGKLLLLPTVYTMTFRLKYNSGRSVAYRTVINMLTVYTMPCNRAGRGVHERHFTGNLLLM